MQLDLVAASVATEARRQLVEEVAASLADLRTMAVLEEYVADEHVEELAERLRAEVRRRFGGDR